MSRADLLERYRALPCRRRRTSRGASPTSRGSTRRRSPPTAPPRSPPRRRCSNWRPRASSASPRRARRSTARPRGSASRRWRDHPRRYELVGSDEKFAAHNAAEWEHGLLVHVPKDVVLEQPLLVRIVNSVEGGSLFWRLLIVAEPGSRVSVIEEYASTTPELSGYLNAAVEIFVEDGAKVEYVSVQNVSRATWHFGSHHARIGRDAELDWVCARLRLQEGEDPDPERPRRPGCDLPCDGRLLRRRRPASRLRHLPGAHRAEHDQSTSPSRARFATSRARSGAG